MISSVIKFPSQFVTQGNELKYQLDVRDCFTNYLLPDLQEDNAPWGTISAYLSAIKHWETRTLNPPVGDITNDTLKDFKKSFTKQGYSPETIKKQWRHLRAILRRVGPQFDKNPLGEGIIERVPYMAPPKNPQRQKIPRIVRHDEIDAIYQACDVATWPYASPCPPPLLWRLALVVFYNCGPRTQDFFKSTRGNIDLETRRISFVAQKTSKLQGVPFQELVGLHFEAVYHYLPGGRSTVIFPVTKCRSSMYEQWRKIQSAAGIKDYVEFRDLRETCNSLLNAANPGAKAGKWVLGHGGRDVNEIFYHNPSPEVLQAVENLEQPDSFYSILE